jgi:hypothetical protein
MRWSGTAMPLLSDRARDRLPQVLDFAAVTGAAMLLAPSGEIACESGSALELDTAHLARLAARAVRTAGDRAHVSFSHAGVCVHAAPIGAGWALCIVSSVGAQPSAVLDRLTRAGRVLALALRDVPFASGGRGGGPTGAPAEVRVRRR